MNKFTPGPWVMGGCSGRMIQPESKAGSDYWIADVDTKANAQIIAAAPMMLEALEFSCKVCNVTSQFCESCEVCPIGAAIKAAKGGAMSNGSNH